MSDGEKTRHEIEKALQALARNEGVERHNLKELLAGRLRILTRAWSLDLTEDLLDVQAAVHDRISAHVAAMPPRKSNSELKEEWRREQFRRVVVVLFNVHPRGSKNPHSTALIKKRYEYLAGLSNTFKGVGIAITDDTARRDFDYARAEIAKVLTRRLEAIVVVNGPLQDAGERASDLGQPPPADSDISAENRSIFKVPNGREAEFSAAPVDARMTASAEPRDTDGGRRKRRILLASGSALVLVAGLVTAGKLTGLIGTTTSNADPASSTSAQPPVVSSATGPAMVTRVAYMREDGMLGAWSYAFAQILPPADVASYGTVSQNEQQYQQWAFNKGGVTADDDRLQIGLRGNQSGTVVIQDIEITKHCQAPLSGTLLYLPPQGQPGDLGIDFDLDQQFPVAEDADTHASYFGASGEGHTITLNQGEVATLLLDVTTSRYYCTFSFSLDISTDTGQEVTEVVNDQGKPFQVTAAAGTGTSIPFSLYRAMYMQNDADNALVPVDPATFP